MNKLIQIFRSPASAQLRAPVSSHHCSFSTFGLIIHRTLPVVIITTDGILDLPTTGMPILKLKYQAMSIHTLWQIVVISVAAIICAYLEAYACVKLWQKIFMG